MPYIIVNRTEITFEEISKTSFAPGLQVNDFRDPRSLVSGKSDVSAEVREKSAAIN